MIDVFDYDIGQRVIITATNGKKIIGPVATVTTAADNDSEYDAISVETAPRYLAEIEANEIESIEIID